MSLLRFLGYIFKEIIVKINSNLIGIFLETFLSFWQVMMIDIYP